MVTAVQTIQRGKREPQSVSKIKVVITSRREKADVRPKRKSVKKNTMLKKGAPGICARAAGYVMNPVTIVANTRH